MGRTLFFAFIALVVAGGVGAAIWRIQADATAEGRGPGGGRAIAVAVEPVAERTFAEIVEALGTARAQESVTVTSRVTDVIARLDFESGDLVEGGRLLAELTGAEEAADLSAARATLEEARREVARVAPLVAQGTLSDSRLDEAQAALERARAQVQAEEARASDLIIRAPFDGVIGLRNVSVGALVRPGDVIATLDDVSVLNVDFTIPEVFLGVVTVGSSVAVRAAAFEDEVFMGSVAQIDSRVDPATRSATMRAEIANEDGRLRPGMLMLVEMRRNERTSPAAPALAVMRRGEQAFVYVLEETDGGPRAARRIVTAGARDAAFVEITSGLEPGERVVSEGVHRVRPGAPVAVASEDGPNGPARGRPEARS